MQHSRHICVIQRLHREIWAFKAKDLILPGAGSAVHRHTYRGGARKDSKPGGLTRSTVEKPKQFSHPFCRLTINRKFQIR